MHCEFILFVGDRCEFILFAGDIDDSVQIKTSYVCIKKMV